MEFSLRTVNFLIGLILVVFLVNVVTTFKFGNSVVRINTSNDTTDVIKFPAFVTSGNVDKSLDCLAMNIYREAAQEPFEGKVAVAQVTLNRVNHPQFPKDVCSVVYQKNIIMEKLVCQFSWYCDSALKKKPSDSEAYQESYDVAKKVLLEGFKLDKLSDALYYHAIYVNPSWSYEKIGKIGNHIFYKARI
mgnify:FL=1